MRPNFALSLSFSGIQLLQAQENGWGRVGDVDIGSADLSGDLTALRVKAEALGSGPVETKLIIPDDQIKYLTVDATGLDKAALQSAVLSALDGATPYPVDELEFDFANETDKVHIAAVAKETLQEAEAFATEHGFAPMGFVAAPSLENFPKEASFGVSSLGKSKGITHLETDGSRAIATGEAVAVVSAPEPENTVVEAPAETPEVSIPVPGFSSRRAQVEPTPEPTVDVAARRTTPEPPANPAPALAGAQRAPELSDAPAPVLPSLSTTQGEAGQSPQITGVSEVALEETSVAAKLEALRPGAAFDDDTPPMPAGYAPAPSVHDGYRGAADSAPMADLRAPAVATTQSFDTPPSEPKKSGADAAAKVVAVVGSVGGTALAGMRALFAKRAKPEPALEPQVAAAPAIVVAKEDEKQRMTIFGARKPKKAAELTAVGGKPRFLGLILTAILLLFLVTVAAWASVFLDDGLARFFGGNDRNKAIAQLPLEDAQPSAEELIELASLDTGETDIILDDQSPTLEAITQVEPLPTPAIISPEEAAAKYAATGIWLATPKQPISPPQISLDDVYLASIDTRITGQDAFALEPLSRPRDALPSNIDGPPPAADAQFVFDNNGLVPATPDGALTPEGALVFLGRPARVPPVVPERLRTASLTPSDVAPSEITGNEITASLRPKTRPSTLVEDTERTQLGGNSRAELAKLRPKLRPKLAKEVEETQAAEIPATRLAVATSRKPSVRPRNFARIVLRAQKQAATQNQSQQATQVAAVAPRAVTPRIPSSASVAKTATVRNAINLSRVNLIGVYGKPSSRRALVRLSSGRYKKVKVGDRVDGGRVSAIGEAQLIYTKRGRNVTLRMPKG